MAQSGFTPVQLYRSTTPAAVPLAADLAAGELAINIADMKLYAENASGVVTLLATAAGASGDVVGPASSTDNAVARFDGTTGKLVQNSVVTIADSTGNMAGVGTLGVGAITTSGALTYGGVTLNNAVTGTGDMALSNSPTFVTPALGTPASGVVTNLTGTASININGTVGATTASTGAFTTLTTSGTVTHNAGTANGVAFLNSSKVLTTGSALTFDGTNLGLGTAINAQRKVNILSGAGVTALAAVGPAGYLLVDNTGSGENYFQANSANIWQGTGGSEQMRLTSTGLGIGTSSPATPLDVQANSSALGIRVRGRASGDGGNIAFFSNNNATEQLSIFSSSSENAFFGTGSRPMTFSTNSAERMRLDSSGNLGLGVTLSAWGSAHRTAFQNNWAGLAGLASTSLMELSSNQFVNSTGNRIYIGTGSAMLYQQNTGQHRWLTAPSGTAGNAISFTQAMTLDASGNLGIGTTSPAVRLSFGTQFLGNNGYANAIRVYDNGEASTSQTSNSYGFGFINSGALSYTAGTGGHHVFFTANTERARITSGGDLLVGLTASAYNTERLTVFKTGNTEAAAIVNDAGANNYTLAVSNRGNTGDNKFVVFATETSDTTRGQIVYNRAAGLTTYSTTSDYRAKDISGPVTDSGALIDATPVYMGKMKGATQERPMFIAHEVPVYAHTGVKDAVDADGNPVYQQMDASALVPVMWAELQSLRARVAQLESN